MNERIKVVIRDGKFTMLWKDNWHPFGILVEMFRDRVAYIVAFDINYKVKKVIRGNF